MSNPTTWTDNGMTWPAAVTPPDGRPMMPYLQAVILAATERANGQALAVTSPPHPNDMLGGIVGVEDLAPDTSWAAGWTYSLDWLITLYLDHYDSGGNWDGSATLPPAWTAVSIMDRIGAERLAPPAAGAPLDWAWIHQQYLIIQELVWTRGACNFIADAGDGHNYFTGTAGPDTLADVKTDSLAAYAGTSSVAIYPYARQFNRISEDLPNYHANLTAHSFFLSIVAPPTSGGAGTASRTLDFYMSTGATQGAEGGGATATFEDFGHGYTENAYNRIETVAFAASDYLTPSSYTQQSAPAPPWAAAPGAGDAANLVGWRADSPFAVIKHDVTNGFDFQ